MTTNRRSSLVMLVACIALLLPMFGSNVAAQDSTGSVDIEIYVCSEGVDPSIALDSLTSQCVETSDPIGILITNGSGYFQLSGEIAPGEPPQQVDIEGVPADQIVITPQLPNGYDNASVYCREGEGQIEAITLDLEGGAPWNLQGEATLNCQVIVFPVDTGATAVASPGAASSSLTVFVHGCPAGFEGTSATELIDACTGHPTTGLYVSDLPDYYESGSTSGIASENSVTLADVPAATLDVWHMYPRAFTTLAVNCDQGSGSDDPSTWAAGSLMSGMTTQVPVKQGALVTCHWFNDAGDVEGDTSGNTLEVRAWNCPAGTEPGDGSWTSYLRECEEPSAQTTFTLDGPGASPGALSNDWHVWQGVPAGEFNLVAAIEDGYGTPVIFCATTTIDSTRIERPAMVNGLHSVTFDQEYAQVMNCDWFNFSTGGSDASTVASANPTLEVSVYTCPSFTFVGPEECVVDDAGVDFNLLQWNGDPAFWSWEVISLVQVGGEGVYTFDNLEAGDYWPLASVGAWCHVESDALDVSGRWIDVEPGAVTAVSLFSCISPET